MYAVDQRLQRVQQQQIRRHDDLQSGRIRVERPAEEETAEQGKQKNGVEQSKEKKSA
jgi:hypothetical protein